MSAESLAVRVLLAIAVILPLAHVCAAAVRRLGQPPVIGEILAGIALVPACSAGCQEASTTGCSPHR